MGEDLVTEGEEAADVVDTIGMAVIEEVGVTEDSKTEEVAVVAEAMEGEEDVEEVTEVIATEEDTMGEASEIMKNTKEQRLSF